MKIFYYLFWDLYRFFSALFAGREIKASKELRDQRLNICKGCPNIKYEDRIFGFIKMKPQPRCGVCGCYLRLKSSLSSEECPDEKLKRW